MKRWFWRHEYAVWMPVLVASVWIAGIAAVGLFFYLVIGGWG